MAGQPGAVGAGALDADQLDLTEAAQPAEQAAVAGRRRVERLDAEQRAVVVERGGDMDVEVGVDAPVIRSGKVVIVIPSLASGWGGTAPPGRRTGQRRASATGS